MSGASSRACLGHVWDIIWVMALLLYYGELLCLIICREFWLILMARRNSIRASSRKRKIPGLVVVLVDSKGASDIAKWAELSHECEAPGTQAWDCLEINRFASVKMKLSMFMNVNYSCN